MRASIVLVFLISALICGSQALSHNLVHGQITYGDIIIYRANEYKYGFPFMTRSSNVIYPPEDGPHFAYIRAVYIKDNDLDGTGGFPAIVSGGVGSKFVKIKLKSQRGYGFNFTITLYGRY